MTVQAGRSWAALAGISAAIRQNLKLFGQNDRYWGVPYLERSDMLRLGFATALAKAGATAALAQTPQGQAPPATQLPHRYPYAIGSPDLAWPAVHTSSGLSSWFGDNARAALDVATRVMIDEQTGKPGAVQMLGLDLHKVVSGDSADIGTLTVQGYLLRFDNVAMRPDFIEDDDDWDFEWRIVTWNHKLSSDGALNAKLGHIELPFGLEHTFDSNGTLRNFLLMPHIGVMADWGVGINGTLEQLDYELTLTRGTGNEWHDSGDPFLACGRFATPCEGNFVAGLSACHGDTGLPGRIVRRTRAALDVQWNVGRFALLGEVGGGRVGGVDVASALFELDIHDDSETFLGFLRCVVESNLSGGSDSSIQAVAGLQWRPDSHWDLSAQVTQDLDTLGSADTNTVLAAQVRFRF
ncbi:MAG: hypothetical protein FJ306_10245 [Planctomycetes bacterium]|nr:hypothetical protein [Planctomycetota bacterium]